MRIPKKVWLKYKNMLSKVDKTAVAKMEAYLRSLGDFDKIPWSAVRYAAAIIDVYGAAAGAGACSMYEAVAEASGVAVRPAEMAELPEIGEVAKVVKGAFKNGSAKVVPGAVGRLVKQVGADTMLKNAKRDGAEFAWIPGGDTCPFCLMLASRGWQKISKAALKNGHAEHIHAHCDCTYAVRFDGKTTIEGYEPEKYREMYDNAEGDTPEEKLKSMRRDASRLSDGSDKKGTLYSVLDEYSKTATPGEGIKGIVKGRRSKNREEINMELIHREFGGDIFMLPEIKKKGQHNPDYRWKGKDWEEQEPIAFTRNAVDANIREAIHQISNNPGGIVLDIGNSDMPIDEVARIAYGRLYRSASFDCDIMIIRKGKIESIYRYKAIKK